MVSLPTILRSKLVCNINSVVPFDVEREYRQRRMSGAGQDLFHMNVGTLRLL